MEARCQAWLGHQQGRLSIPELGHSYRYATLAQEEPGRVGGGTSVNTEALTGLSELPAMAYRIGGGGRGQTCISLEKGRGFKEFVAGLKFSLAKAAVSQDSKRDPGLLFRRSLAKGPSCWWPPVREGWGSWPISDQSAHRSVTEL